MDPFTAQHRSNRPYRMLVTPIALLALTGAAFGGGSVTLNPANSIQAAINSGQYSEIVLEPGTYNQTIVIDAAQAPLTIRSVDPASESTVDNTILDGSFLDTSIILLTSGVGPDVVIDGLTLADGNATGGSAPAHRGGAIDCESASPTIRRCVLMNNHADVAGGGLYVNAGNMTLEDCTFLSNTSDYGAGVYCNNSTVTFVRCTFRNNVASVRGGGCRLYTGTYLFNDCQFVQNSAVDYGGGISRENSGTATIDRCLFDGNDCTPADPADGRGGGLYITGTGTVLVANSIFTGNVVNRFGAAIYCNHDATVIRNCTSYANSAESSGFIDTAGSDNIQVVNCISWSDMPNSIAGTGSQTVRYCNIQGGFAGAGNIGGDSADQPLFVDAMNGDFRLMEASAGIDAGDTTSLPAGYPLAYDGLPRALDDPSTTDTGIAVVGISVDMGAFEFQPVGGPVDPCPADLNDDSVIDVFDLFDLLAAWGACD